MPEPQSNIEKPVIDLQHEAANKANITHGSQPEYLGGKQGTELLTKLEQEPLSRDEYDAAHLVNSRFKDDPKILSKKTGALVLDLARESVENLKDSLTGLEGRASWRKKTIQLLKEFDRLPGCFLLTMMDFDNFKEINDKYGHLAGDQVIVAVSHLIKTNFRDADIIGRYGLGDEFHQAGISGEIDARKIIAHFSQLQQTLSNTQIPINENKQTLNVTQSWGLAIISHEKMNEIKQSITIPLTDEQYYPTLLDKIIKIADDALYESKDRGKNRLCVNPDAIPTPVDPPTLL